jgi:hypothetical protein
MNLFKESSIIMGNTGGVIHVMCLVFTVKLDQFEK